jgi:hypothetical protein
MTEANDIFERMFVRLGRTDETLREIAERIAQLDRRQQPDVPLHQRGFGVMDEPPA